MVLRYIDESRTVCNARAVCTRNARDARSRLKKDSASTLLVTMRWSRGREKGEERHDTPTTRRRCRRLGERHLRAYHSAGMVQCVRGRRGAWPGRGVEFDGLFPARSRTQYSVVGGPHRGSLPCPGPASAKAVCCSRGGCDGTSPGVPSGLDATERRSLERQRTTGGHPSCFRQAIPTSASELLPALVLTRGSRGGGMQCSQS